MDRHASVEAGSGSAQAGSTLAHGQPKLLVIDGHCYAYRAFFAIRSLSSPTGAATNAIYGFIRMLMKIQAQIQPTHVIVVWDGGLAQERMTLLPGYKAQRAEMPSDLEAQLDHIVDYLRGANIASYMKNGCEADDCIAAITERAVAAGWDVVIGTSDKDFMQLVSPRVTLLNPHDKTGTLVGVEQVRAKTGVEPTQIVDWLSMIGDSVDNIPGVPGVGPKTAADLLHQFGSVNALYARLGEVRSERVRGSLEKSAEVLRRNQRLVQLHVEAGCEVPLEDLAVRPVDGERLRELFSVWGFKRLSQELEEARMKAADLFVEHAGAA
ncbi:MAG TPA: 5'-3' exonuclease H3TH domain-containing protein [Verrucomicrobiae bacterium]|jgi:DNA polymerase-1|nr:5'-3' exonuclease H3TH domain-containing protein [Verrucomicrobiae bacterium]